MKIHIANYEPNRLGGGWTFMNNFVKGMGDKIGSYEESEHYFICGPTMVQREDVEKAKADGKKIIFRIDNVVRNSRNRNTGMPRMKDFAEWADLVVYQSNWAKNYLMPFTKKDGAVILNGCDTSLFRSEEKIPSSYLYSRFNRDETKNWEVARYWYSRLWVETEPTHPRLHIVGNFSPELVEGNFDFYQGEAYEYHGNLSHENYAKILRRMENFIYPYYNDACSNSLIEARASGCAIIDPSDDYYLNTGGASEIMELQDLSLERMCKQYEQEISRI